MASGITNNDSLFYVGEVPWHGLGTGVEECLTAAEAMTTAGLNWTVSKRPLYYSWEDQPVFQNALTRIEGRFGMLRDDLSGPEAFLGVVGERYTPVLNVECFSFLDAVVGQGEVPVTYETAGSLFGGRRVWMMAQVPREIRIAGTDDVTKVKILLTSSHDGSSGITAAVIPFRVICANTLNAALKQAQSRWSITHTSNVQQRIEEATHTLGLTLAYADKFEEAANELARRPMLAKEIEKLTELLFPAMENGEVSGKTKNQREAVKWAFEAEETNNLRGIRGTRWAAYNAVTAFTDHFRPTSVKDPAGLLSEEQKAERRIENKVNSIWEGSGAKLKEQAFDLLLKVTLPEPEKVPA